jgi:hypothetical protein
MLRVARLSARAAYVALRKVHKLEDQEVKLLDKGRLIEAAGVRKSLSLARLRYLYHQGNISKNYQIGYATLSRVPVYLECLAFEGRAQATLGFKVDVSKLPQGQREKLAGLRDSLRKDVKELAKWRRKLFTWLGKKPGPLYKRSLKYLLRKVDQLSPKVQSQTLRLGYVLSLVEARNGFEVAADLPGGVGDLAKTAKINFSEDIIRKVLDGKAVSREEVLALLGEAKRIRGYITYQVFVKNVFAKVSGKIKDGIVDRAVPKKDRAFVKNLLRGKFEKTPVIQAKLKRLKQLAIAGKFNSKEAGEIQRDLFRRIKLLTLAWIYQRLVSQAKNSHKRTVIKIWNGTLVVKGGKGSGYRAIQKAGSDNWLNLSNLQGFLSRARSGSLRLSYSYVMGRQDQLSDTIKKWFGTIRRGKIRVVIPHNLGRMSDRKFGKLFYQYFYPINNFMKEVDSSVRFKHTANYVVKEIAVVAMAAMAAGNVAGALTKFGRTISVLSGLFRAGPTLRLARLGRFAVKVAAFTAAAIPLRPLFNLPSHGSFGKQYMGNLAMFAGHGIFKKLTPGGALRPLSDLGFFTGWGGLGEWIDGKPLSKINWKGHFVGALQYSIGLALPGLVSRAVGVPGRLADGYKEARPGFKRSYRAFKKEGKRIARDFAKLFKPGKSPRFLKNAFRRVVGRLKRLRKSLVKLRKSIKNKNSAAYKLAKFWEGRMARLERLARWGRDQSTVQVAEVNGQTVIVRGRINPSTQLLTEAAKLCNKSGKNSKGSIIYLRETVDGKIKVSLINPNGRKIGKAKGKYVITDSSGRLLTFTRYKKPADALVALVDLARYSLGQRGLVGGNSKVPKETRVGEMRVGSSKSPSLGDFVKLMTSNGQAPKEVKLGKDSYRVEIKVVDDQGQVKTQHINVDGATLAHIRHAWRTIAAIKGGENVGLQGKDIFIGDGGKGVYFRNIPREVMEPLLHYRIAMAERAGKIQYGLPQAQSGGRDAYSQPVKEGDAGRNTPLRNSPVPLNAETAKRLLDNFHVYNENGSVKVERGQVRRGKILNYILTLKFEKNEYRYYITPEYRNKILARQRKANKKRGDWGRKKLWRKARKLLEKYNYVGIEPGKTKNGKIVDFIFVGESKKGNKKGYRKKISPELKGILLYFVGRSGFPKAGLHVAKPGARSPRPPKLKLPREQELSGVNEPSKSAKPDPIVTHDEKRYFMHSVKKDLRSGHGFEIHPLEVGKGQAQKFIIYKTDPEGKIKQAYKVDREMRDGVINEKWKANKERTQRNKRADNPIGNQAKPKKASKPKQINEGTKVDKPV